MGPRFFLFVIYIFVFINSALSFRKYSKEHVKGLREEVREMFQHAYDGYLKYAKNYDELRPLSCDGVDTWGSYSLTLIDALDTLAVMGNYSEFQRVVSILVENSNFDTDINVSVFETNIRIVGGLLSAHLMSHKAGMELEKGWPCNGPLLRMAEDVARRLLPAFDTKTGMPYGTVNLKYGVPVGETSVTCTAGVGTFIVEFGALSRLTGDPIFEEVALNALYSLWNHRSPIGLFGNHIDVQSGRWTAQDAGIGAGVDSYYEYLVKGAIMLNKPELLDMFHEGRKAIDKYLKRDDWHIWVSMNKGQVTLPVFQSLEAYWPGVLSLIGDTIPAMRTLHNYHSVWKQYGFLPEFYNIPSAEAGVNRENYPLRPELIESVMYLYRSTGDPYLLEVGEDILRSIQYSAKTSCGYATIKNVRDHRKEDRMESFFLAETTKYLYLLFDPTNFLNNDGRIGTIVNTPNGECVIDAGGFIFNTEAHPIDPAALKCCYDKPRQDLLEGFHIEKYLGDVLEKRSPSKTLRNKCKKHQQQESDQNIIVDIPATIDAEATRKKIISEVTKHFESKDVNKEKTEKSQEEHNLKINDISGLFQDLADKLGRSQDMELEESKRKTIIESMKILKKSFESAKLISPEERESDDNKSSESNLEPESIVFSLNERKKHENTISLYNKALESLAQTNLTLIVLRDLERIVEIHGFKSLLWFRTAILEDNSQTNQNFTDEEVEISEALINELKKYENINSENDNQAVIEKRKYFEALLQLLKIKLYKSILGMSNKTIYIHFDESSDSSLVENGNNKDDDDIIVAVNDNKIMDSNLSKSEISDKTVIESVHDISDLLSPDDDKVEEISSSENHEKDVIKEVFVNVIEDPDDNMETGTGTVEPINLEQFAVSGQDFDKDVKDFIEKTTNDIIRKPSNDHDQVTESSGNNSIISDFVQSILKSTLSKRIKFDPEAFLERIRTEGLYLNKTKNFRQLTCQAQPFLQRMTIHGEFF